MIAYFFSLLFCIAWSWDCDVLFTVNDCTLCILTAGWASVAYLSTWTAFHGRAESPCVRQVFEVADKLEANATV